MSGFFFGEDLAMAKHTELTRHDLDALRLAVDNLDKIYPALGAFIWQFAQTEAFVHRMVATFGDLSEPVARAILSGVQMKVAMDHIKAIGTNVGMDLAIWNVMKESFDQLGVVTDLRNSIVHYGTGYFSSTGVLVSNKSRTRTEDAGYEHELTVQMLHDASSDLDEIMGGLRWVLLVRTKKAAQVKIHVHAPWRYKSPLQGAKTGKSPRSGPKPPRPPKPSRGKS